MLARLYAISSWVSTHITVLVVAVTVVALFIPESFLWMETSVVTPLLGIVMFGMGLTLKPTDFVPVIKRPKDIIIGELAQFIIMPLIAWLLCQILALPSELALGVILVATHFALYPMATVPGAIFSVWHNFSGSLFAGMLAGKDKKALLKSTAEAFSKENKNKTN